MKCKYLLAMIVLSILVSTSYGQGDFFADWDLNRDGKVTLNEFPGGPSNAAYFNKIDFNKDKVLTRAELDAFLSGTTPKPEKLKHHPVKIGKVHKLKNEIRALKQQNRKMKIKYEKANRVNRKQMKALQKEIKHLKRQNQQLQKLPFLGGNTNHQTLQKQNQSLQQQVKEMQLQNQKLKRLATFSGNNSQLKQQNQQLQVQIQQLQKQLAQSKQNNAKLRAQVQKLQRQLSVRPQPTPRPTPNPRPQQPAQPVAFEDPSLRKPPSPAQNMLMAEEAARLDAFRALADRINGSWVAAASENVDGVNKLLIIGKLMPTQMFGVRQGSAQFDFANGMVIMPVEISRANIIESIHRTQKGLTAEDYQELRYLFPEKMTAVGRGTWLPRGQKRLMALYGAQLDARRKLVEQLRGFMIKSSTRMEDFVVTNHKVTLSIQTTLLVGVKVLEEKIVSNAIAQSTIGLSRTMFIYSIRKGMQANGLSLSPAEYQNLRNLLTEKFYKFTGKAAIK